MASKADLKQHAPQKEPLTHPDCDPLAKKPVPDAKNAKPEEKKDKDSKGFMFDIIVVRLDIPNKVIKEQKNIIVEIMLNKDRILITPSRINVLDFKPEKTYAFEANPIILRDDLAKNPLKFKVTEEQEILGYGSIDWPDDFRTGLVECTGEMTHSFETELRECDGMRVGTIHVVVRLTPRCQEYVIDQSPDVRCCNANAAIDANDVLFVVGENRTTCCCTDVGIIPASDSDNEMGPRCLDLSNFRAINSQSVDNMDMLASLDPACQNIKTISNQYQTIFDALKCASRTKAQSVKQSYRNKTDFISAVPSSKSLTMIPSNTDSCIMPAHCPLEHLEFGAMNVKQFPQLNTPPELIDNQPEALRRCPLCKENMDYLPKLAACPNCCYKPIPYFEEKPYDETQNAIDIIRDFPKKFQNSEDLTSDTQIKEQGKCRCSCKYGSEKPCAHCRIRKLCEHIFQASPAKPDDVPEPCERKSSEVQCVSSSENRPFLSRIFSELKDLYDIEEPKKKSFVPDERCERELNKEPIKPKQYCHKYETKQYSRNEEVVPQNQVVDKLEETKPPKFRKRKKRSAKRPQQPSQCRLYDYELPRERYQPNIGHKTCINGFAGRKNVPPNMGWLWNAHNTGKWKPGAIRKPIKELMKYFLKDFPADTIIVSRYRYRKESKAKNQNDSQLSNLVQKPTLHIIKKNGEYIVTMRPLKPYEQLKDAADPYENMRPIKFRIVKKPQMEAVRNLKASLKNMGFKKCTCHRPIMYCFCRRFLDKKKLEFECNRECAKRNIEPCCDTLVLSDTSDSEEEFDFGVTPPVGVIKPERLRKINLINVATQYEERDWNPVPNFPLPPNKHMQMYHCAVGERKKKVIGAGDGKAGKNAVMTGSGRDACPKGGPVPTMGRFPGMGGEFGGGMGGFGGAKGGGFGGAKGGGFGGAKGGGLAEAIGGAKGGAKSGNVGGVFGGAMVGGFGSAKAGAEAAGFGGAAGSGAKGGKTVGVTTGAAGKLSAPSYNRAGGDGLGAPGAPRAKVNMMKYTMNAIKRSKMSPEEKAVKRRARWLQLRGANPPLLCTIDRLVKPIDPCHPCPPCAERIC